MLRDSRILEMLEAHAFDSDGEPMCLYVDPAYPLRVHLQAPFGMVVPNPDMVAFNKSMSKVRVSVEWLFGDIINNFKFMDFKDLLFMLSIVCNAIGLLSLQKLPLLQSLCVQSQLSHYERTNKR